MVATSTSTCAHFAPVLHAPGFSGLFLPSTVSVTVCVPAARASRAQTTRPRLERRRVEVDDLGLAVVDLHLREALVGADAC